MTTKLTSRHCLSVLVANEPGVLARVIGLFSGRGFNIESLAVAEVDSKKNLSRITIVTIGTIDIVGQIQAQLLRLVPVRKVVNLSASGECVEREMALVKVSGSATERAEALRIAAANFAQAVDVNASPLIFTMTGASDEIDRFLDQLRPCGLVEVVRTGTLAIGADNETL